MKQVIETMVRDVTSLGGVVFTLVLLLIEWKRNLFWQLLFGFVVLLGIVVVIRTFYFKDRPKKQKFSNFIERLDASSFPSLHAARAMFVALAFGLEYGLLGLWLIFAAAICYSRIYLRKHDWVDVTAGVVLGIGVYVISHVLLLLGHLWLLQWFPFY